MARWALCFALALDVLSSVPQLHGDHLALSGVLVLNPALGQPSGSA